MRNEHIFGNKIWKPIQLNVEIQYGCYCGTGSSTVVPITFNDVYEFNKFLDSNNQNTTGFYFSFYKDDVRLEVTYEN